MTSLNSLTEHRLDDLLDTVLANVGGDDPRLIEIMNGLIRHAHAFVREVQPTEDEWLAGLAFLVRVGHMCDDKRNEFILMSDMLGLTSAVDEVNFPGIAEATPSSVEGPFHSAAAPRANGDWVANGPERERAEPMLVRGRVTDLEGKPIAGATIDIWQADDTGHYDVQDPQQELGNLRGLFTTNEFGEYWFRSVVPCSYSVPTDGPMGDLLIAIGRHPMRPAHIHYRVEAEGFRPVTTHVFVAGDPYLDSDAAFAVKPEIVVTPTLVSDPAIAQANGMPGPFQDFIFDIALVPLAHSGVTA